MHAIQTSPANYHANYLPLVEPTDFDGPSFGVGNPANDTTARRPNIVAKRARRDARLAARRA